MWIMVLFDLPVMTKKERKAATGFRTHLLDLGFEMAQFSVYLRFCAGKEQSESITRKVRTKLPSGGKVDILYFTDKQYENIVSYTGRTKQDSRKNPGQFELF
ncbi:CRISPR-associated protein Cas2 [Thalassospira alkalitolerans]|uniref:CRISPR-associated endoribonuclease Cas2 n=2 Tax=Thalassospira alkalitolerans TaxID=1293890 RepID=A0A1Y2L640_9PROT|nr:CRISPR-associated protein Cas2 [Thalassospira alkalitolerans]